MLLLAAFTGTASAHAAYEASDPADGSTVSNPPSRVIAEFTEPVVQGSNLEVYDPCGAKVDNGDSIVASDRITVTMSGDKQGTYTVAFNVVSAVDGHNTSGEFTFTSSGGAACPGAEPEPQPQPNGPSSGGSGGGSEPSSRNRESGTSTPTSPSAPAGGGGTSRTSTSPAANGGGQAGQRQGSQAARQGRPARQAQEGQVREFVQAESGETLPVGAASTGSNDIPLDGVLISLVLATMIGAAGGHVLSGILGPRR